MKIRQIFGGFFLLLKFFHPAAVIIFVEVKIMTDIDKISTNTNIPYRNAANSQEQKSQKKSVFGYKSGIMNDFYPDFKTKQISEDAKKLKNDWVKIVPDFSEEFAQKIVDASKNIKCDAEDLAALLFKESRFDPKAGKGSYKGIGQMNRRSLNASIEYALEKGYQDIDPDMDMKKFKTLTREEQLPYVECYLLAMKKMAKFKDEEFLDAGRLYGLVYTPSNAKKKVYSSALSPDTAKYYHANKGLDFDGDGKITPQDLEKVVSSVKKIPKQVPDFSNSFIFRPPEDNV